MQDGQSFWKRNTVKRNVSLALGAALVFGAVPAYAADAVTVKLNGSQMEFDVNPVIENSRTLVPFRKIFEALDCAVSYTKENGAQVVTANRGNKWITLEIGKNEITVDGETKKLDVAPKIVNGRTLVPLRAISEGLDCTVDWSADTKTVDIQKKQGQYAVSSAHISKNITDDKGNILITIAFEYPVIENKDNNAFITAVNEQYKKDAEAAISEAEAEFKDSAAAVLASEGKNYHPMVFTRSFEVSLNQDNLLSITQLDYANTYGAHPNTLKSSKTFNLAENKALTLSEVLGKNAADTDSYVKEKFDAYVKETVGELLEYYQQNSEKALSAVNFCLTEDALVLYYNPYDILPYAAGSPEVKVPYADTTIKLALAES